MNSSSNPATFTNRAAPSRAMLLCALVALATLFVTAAAFRWPMTIIVLPFCAIALILSHATPKRWPRDAMAPKVLRLVLFPLLFVFGNRATIDIDWLFDPRTLSFLGTLAAVELVLQFWREPANTNSSASSDKMAHERFPAVCLLLVCAIFLAGSNTRFDNYVAYITPLFWSLLLWSLLDWRHIANAQPLPSKATQSPAKQTQRLVWGRRPIAFFVLALGSGALLNGLMVHFKDELMTIGSQVIRDRLSQSVGVSNRPQLGSRFEVPESPQRVLRVEGRLSDPHLRAASFDFYQDGAWSPAANEIRAITLTPQELGSDAPGPRTRITRLIDVEGNLLFATLNSSGLVPGQGIDIDGVTVEGDRTSGLLRCDEVAPFRYEIIDNSQNTNGVLTHQGPLSAPLTAESRRKYLQIPPDFDPRVRELARSITQSSLHPAQSAESIGEYLMSNHSYSLVARRGEGDPVTNFLLDKRDAHCEYFASAMVLLARCSGIPARYVVGYLAHEAALGSRGERGTVTVVRQRDAHAWAELWIDGVGWITADATPGDGTPLRFGNAAPWQRAWEWAQDTLELIRERAVQTPKSTWAMIIGIPLGLWILIRARPMRRQQNAENSWQYANADERLNVLAARFESWMAREHWMCPPSQSWRRYFADLGRSDVLNWIAHYERARFGFDHDTHQLEMLEKKLIAIETAPQITAEVLTEKGTP